MSTIPYKGRKITYTGYSKLRITVYRIHLNAQGYSRKYNKVGAAHVYYGVGKPVFQVLCQRGYGTNYHSETYIMRAIDRHDARQQARHRYTQEFALLPHEIT